MNLIRYAMFGAAAVASVTACGGNVPHASQPVATPSGTSESASSCSSATADVLKSAIQRQYGAPESAFSGPFSVDDVLCSGDWAKALIDYEGFDPNTNPPGIVLFHDDGGDGWRVVNYGSGFDCTNDGVPPSIADDLEC